MKSALFAALPIVLLITHSGLCQVPGTKLWQVRVPGQILTSPAIAEDGTVYVGCGDGTDLVNRGWLCSFSPQGTTNWILVFPQGVRSSPAIGADGTIYVGCWNGELKIVSPTGTFSKVPTGGHIVASPAIAADGTVYVGSISNKFNRLFAFTRDGTVKWVFKMGAVEYLQPDTNQSSSPAIGPDGTIYVGSMDKNLYAINPDGSTNWVFRLVSMTNSTASVTHASPAIGLDGTIYLGADNGVVYAIGSQGLVKWKVQMPRVVESSVAVDGNGSIYFGCIWTDGPFFALNADGTQRWSLPCTGISASPAVDVQGCVYFGSYGNSNLYAFSASGTNLWSFAAADMIFSSPTIGPDGTIYFGAGTTLYALYGTNSLMNSSWPMFRGNVKHTARSIQRGVQKPNVLGDSTVALNLNLETGRVYQVEYSTNLVNWSELTNFVSTNFTQQFIDTTSINSEQRYYRLKTGLP